MWSLGRIGCMGGAILALGALTGCGISIPTDPNGTLEHVRNGILRVGVSPNDGWTEFVGDEPSGVDVELVAEFADRLDTEVVWKAGGEEALIGERGELDLDLVIGGLTDKSPWVDRAVLTKPFAEVIGEDGSSEKHVMAAPLGENATRRR